LAGSGFGGSFWGAGGRGRGVAGLAGRSPTGSGGGVSVVVVTGSISRGGGGGTSRLGRSTGVFAWVVAHPDSGASTNSSSNKPRFIVFHRRPANEPEPHRRRGGGETLLLLSNCRIGHHPGTWTARHKKKNSPLLPFSC
jgi:hypothetical protein